MTLQLFLRAWVTAIFQSQVIYNKTNFHNEKMSYDNQLFYTPRIVCKDGFSVSLQIHNSNYCSTENGHREFGYSYQSVEFGFPSENDKDLAKFSEMYGYSSYNYDVPEGEDAVEIPFNEETFDCTGTVGSVPIEDIQRILDNHGGIDWETTLSVDSCKQLTKN